MPLGVSIWYMICLISLQVIILTVVESKFLASYNNGTNHGSLWKSNRSKRSIFHKMPWILRIKVKLPTGEQITLKWIKCNSNLANKYLPVITPIAEFNPSVIEDIGEFVMYHDIDKCSAVVYFQKIHKLHGVIGTNYYVRDLPFDFNAKGDYTMGIAEQPFIMENYYTFGYNDPTPLAPFDFNNNEDTPNSFQYNSNENIKRPIDSDAGPSTKRQRIEPTMTKNRIENMAESVDDDIRIMDRKECQYEYQEYYVETLIFISGDIARRFKNYFGRENYIAHIVRYYIIYFNAVDMIFKKSQTLLNPVHINIAKIIIEDDILPFSFIDDQALQFNEIVVKLSTYLELHKNQYSPDSFDYVFVHTSRPFWDASTMVNGKTKHGADLYRARKNNQFYNMVPISVVNFKLGMHDYVVAAREIGLIFDIGINPWEKKACSTGQYHDITRREGPKRLNCLKWSYISKNQLQTFLSTNRNRCFFLNYPRSLQPFPITKPLKPNKQCRCFGYDSYIKSPNGQVPKNINKDECSKPLQCQNDGKDPYIESTVLPFDGTLCSQSKICSDRKCI